MDDGQAILGVGAIDSVLGNRDAQFTFQQGIVNPQHGSGMPDTKHGGVAIQPEIAIQAVPEYGGDQPVGEKQQEQERG